MPRPQERPPRPPGSLAHSRRPWYPLRCNLFRAAAFPQPTLAAAALPRQRGCPAVVAPLLASSLAPAPTGHTRAPPGLPPQPSWSGPPLPVLPPLASSLVPGGWLSRDDITSPLPPQPRSSQRRLPLHAAAPPISVHNSEPAASHSLVNRRDWRWPLRLSLLALAHSQAATCPAVWSRAVPPCFHRRRWPRGPTCGLTRRRQPTAALQPD